MLDRKSEGKKMKPPPRRGGGEFPTFGALFKEEGVKRHF